MPLYKTIAVSNHTKVYIWKITESFQALLNAVVLNQISNNRLAAMKSEMHQRGFLSIRKLLQEAGYTDNDLKYDAFGKPHLIDNKHISITHSHHFSALIISNEPCGIDIEMNREKIIGIATKFIESELDYLNPENEPEYIKKLTIIWGAKECIFKIKNEEGISFKNHISVEPFELSQNQTLAKLHIPETICSFEIHFESIEEFALVYAFIKK